MDYCRPPAALARTAAVAPPSTIHHPSSTIPHPPPRGTATLLSSALRVLSPLVAVLVFWCGCKSAPPPAPVPEARRQAQLTAASAAKLSQVQNWNGAARQWELAGNQFATLEDLTNEAVALHNEAQARSELGNASRAQQLLEQAAALNREIGNTNEWWRNQIALLQLESQTQQETTLSNRFDHLDRVLPTLTPKELRGLFYNELGQWKLQRGDLSQAEDAFRQAESAFTQCNSKEGLAAIMANRALLWTAQTNYPAALREWTRSLHAYEALADPQGIARALAGLGTTRLGSGQDLPQAERDLRRAAHNYETLNQPAERIRVLQSLVACLKAQHKPLAPEQAELAQAHEANATRLETAAQWKAARAQWQASADLWGELDRAEARQKALEGVKRCTRS